MLSTPSGPAVVREDPTAGAAEVGPHSLLWTDTAVVARLARDGLSPVARGPVSQPLLHRIGERISVAGGAAEVQAFIYADAGAVGVATQGLDVSRIAGAVPASVAANNNLATIILSRDGALRERIRRAITARLGADEESRVVAAPRSPR